MYNFFSRNVVLIFTLVVLGLLGASYAWMTTTNGVALSQQELRITELESQINAERVVVAEAEQTVVDEAVGTNDARVDGDAELIRSLISKVATWSDAAEYEQARDSVMRTYGLGESSQFMSEFFTPSVFNTDSSGERYYVIDAEGLNSSLGSVEAQVLSVAGTEYRYMVLAEFESLSNDGNASADQTSIIFVTVDGEGQLSDITGYSSIEGTLRSN